MIRSQKVDNVFLRCPFRRFTLERIHNSTGQQQQKASMGRMKSIQLPADLTSIKCNLKTITDRGNPLEY